MLCTVINSCGLNFEKDCYNFDNFKETPLWEVAQAVRADDSDEIKQILKEKKLEIDLNDPNYNQTLLALAIQNEKRNAFLTLLTEGSNPNKLVGNPKDATPFIYGIKKVRSCDLFYVENMLHHGANPNLEIKNPKPGYYFQNSFPLLVAISNQTNRCLDLIKLLVDNGANINCCYKESSSDFCEGVIAKTLLLNDMETLKYFVVEKKMNIPDTVIVMGEDDKATQEVYGLKEVLNSQYYEYEDFVRDGKKFDRSKSRNIKNEILEYLEKNKAKKQKANHY